MIYRGVGGVNRQIIQQYRGVSGVNRTINQQYRGVNGVNRLIFSNKLKGSDIAKVTMNVWRTIAKFDSSGSSASTSYASYSNNSSSISCSSTGGNTDVIQRTRYINNSFIITDKYGTTYDVYSASIHGILTTVLPQITFNITFNLSWSGNGNGYYTSFIKKFSYGSLSGESFSFDETVYLTDYNPDINTVYIASYGVYDANTTLIVRSCTSEGYSIPFEFVLKGSY